MVTFEIMFIVYPHGRTPDPLTRVLSLFSLEQATRLAAALRVSSHPSRATQCFAHLAVGLGLSFPGTC